MSRYKGIKAAAEKIKREVPIINYFQVLVSRGILKYEGIQGREFFFGFPNQKTGSISIDDTANLWYDHSSGRGGDIIEAVQLFENKGFFEAVESLSGTSPIESTIARKKIEKTNNIEIIKTVEITHNALISYLKTRGLNLLDLYSFAKEVHWRNGDKKYFAIGFKNDEEGWVLRSAIFKGNILTGGISTVLLGNGGGLKIFEGWFDFISYLKLTKADNIKGIVLNSTANLTFKLMNEVLTNNECVDLYLDNDNTGGHHTNEMINFSKIINYCRKNSIAMEDSFNSFRGGKDKLSQIISSLKIPQSDIPKIWETPSNVNDQRSYYKDFEDINMLLVSKTSRE